MSQQYSNEELITIIRKLYKRLDELQAEVTAYQKRKDELEIELQKSNRRMNMYLDIIKRFMKRKDLKNNLDLSMDYRVSKLEDKFMEIESNIDRCNKLIVSTRSTLNDFLNRIYK